MTDIKQRFIANSTLRRLHQICYDQALAGGLPTEGGGSEFGCLMAALTELIDLKEAFGCYANHISNCRITKGSHCDCGCADLRKQIQRSII